MDVRIYGRANNLGVDAHVGVEDARDQVRHVARERQARVHPEYRVVVQLLLSSLRFRACIWGVMISGGCSARAEDA